LPDLFLQKLFGQMRKGLQKQERMKYNMRLKGVK